MLDSLYSFIQSKGFSFSPDILDGGWYEVRCALTNSKLSYKGTIDNENKISFVFKEWKNQDNLFIYKDENFKELSKEERIAKKLKQESTWKLCGEFARVLFETCSSVAPTRGNYLHKKGFATHDYSHLNIRYTYDHTDKVLLVVPVTDFNGNICNLHFIQENSHKSFLGRAKYRGCFFSTHNLKNSKDNKLFICEGVSTLLSIHKAFPDSEVMCSFGTGNFEHLLKEFKKRKISKEFILVLDNDHEKSTNSGKETATKLSEKYMGISVALPQEVGAGESDYNDLMQSRGVDYIREDILKQIQFSNESKEQIEMGIDSTNLDQVSEEPTAETPAPKESRISSVAWHIEKYVNGVMPIPPRYNEKGTQIIPEESEVAEHIMKYYDGNIVASQGSFFIYKKTHWVEMTDLEHAELMRQIVVAHNGKGTNKRFESVKKIFLNFVPRVTKDLFSPNPWLTNFQNGTLHIIKDAPKKYHFEFKPHNKKDLTTTMVPIEYDTSRQIRNPEFDALILRLLGGNEDKVRMLKQMYGACLAPIFPHFFLFYGPSGFGKSSLIIPAMLLVHKDNYSSVGPSQMYGFEIEAMLGKLINVDTDIDTQEPMNDALMKKIEDNLPVHINRKGKTVVKAHVPRIHIYGANSMPKTLEKSDAHDRRWTFVKVNYFKVPPTEKEKFIANRIFADNPQAVLNFALEGLEDLLGHSGEYFDSVESKTNKAAWKLENDVVGRFINDIKEIGIEGLSVDPNNSELQIASKTLWEKFNTWHRSEEGAEAKLTLNTLRKSLSNLGFESGRTKTARFVKGIGFTKNSSQKTPFEI